MKKTFHVSLREWRRNLIKKRCIWKGQNINGIVFCCETRFRAGSLAKRSGASATENIIKAMKSRSVSMRHERLSTDFDVITIFIVFLFLSRRRVEARRGSWKRRRKWWKASNVFMMQKARDLIKCKRFLFPCLWVGVLTSFLFNDVVRMENFHIFFVDLMIFAIRLRVWERVEESGSEWNLIILCGSLLELTQRYRFVVVDSRAFLPPLEAL